MGIGTPSQLYNAAQGRMAPRIIAPPPSLDPEADVAAARARREALGKTASATIAAGQTIDPNPNLVYSGILSNARRARGGLNTSGKYSGFNNAGDLQSAVEGSAISLGRTTTPQLLRNKATSFYDKLNPAYEESWDDPDEYVKANPGVLLNDVFPKEVNGVRPPAGQFADAARNYRLALAKWYVDQSNVAENYLEAAQQLENTPLSSLASRLATSSYGMNPDLAAGKFGGLDTTYFNQQRDISSMQQYGMPYDDYQAKQKADAKAIPGQYAQAIANSTGYNPTTISGLTGQTPEQMYASYATDYTYEDPETGEEVVRNGQAIVEIMRDYLYAGDIELAADLADALGGQQDLARILNAQYNVGVVRNTKNRQANEAYSG